MRYKLRVRKYGGGRELVCCIVGGGHLPWVVLLVLGRDRMAKYFWMRQICVALEIRSIDVLLSVPVLL
jgi:hypothetical protein